jgi:acyl-CoA synthetase (AMP-forming)/AMP-acid ligase II
MIKPDASVSPFPYGTLTEGLLAAPHEQTFVTIWEDEDDVESVTFGEFIGRAQAQAEILHAQGAGPGDTFILIMPQGIALMAAFAGAMLLGAIPAILAYPTFKVEPTKYRFGLAGVSANLKAKLVVIDESFPDELLGHVNLSEHCTVVRAGTGKATSAFVPTIPHSADRLAFIQHSAGTTGLQKGVALSHAAVLRQLSHLVPAIRITPQDCIYSWLPLYHDMGLIACFMLPMVCHLPVVMQSPTTWVLQPGAMLQLIAQYRCTLAWIPNFTLQFLSRRVNAQERDGLDLSCLRALINCSEPVRPNSMDEFRRAYGGCKLQPNVLQSSYAMAETVFAVTQSGMHDQPGPVRIWVDSDSLSQKKVAIPVAANTPGATCFVSSGRCLPGTQVRIASDTAADLPEGGVGEILILSDSLLDGYYNRPDLTAKVLREGWFWSGDLGFYLDGELFVIGRKKDLIIVGGKNIYPQDIEEIVCSHPKIYDGRAVALGIYNQDLGTEEIVVVAEVRREEDLADHDSIDRTVRSRITAELGVAARAIYLKPPRWVVKSTAGKPARSTTREKLLAEHPELQTTQG